jgi:hypothetical protein
VTVPGVAAGSNVNTSASATGPSPRIRISDATAGWQFTCARGRFAGTVTTGRHPDTSRVGTVRGTSLHLVDCTGNGGLPLFNGNIGRGTWSFVPQTYTAESDAVSGVLTGVRLHVFTSDHATCVFDLAGQQSAVYDNTSGTMQLTDDGPGLIQQNTTGCFGLLNDGDHWSLGWSGSPTTFAINPNSGSGHVTIRAASR